MVIDVEGFDVLDVGYQEVREPMISSGRLVESDF
jgi:hypothetical protein